MRVSVLGAGAIALALARPWNTAGHEVTLGVRDPSRAPDVPGVRVRHLPDALKSPEVTVMAIPAAAVPDICTRYAELLAGRIVIDPTITFSSGGSPVMHQHEPLEQVGVRYVRAFSTQGPEVLAAPVIDGETADQFYTADDDQARDLAAHLIADVGLRPVYVGGSDRVNIVDGVTRLWFSLAIKQDLGRHLSFRLLADLQKGQG